MDFVKRKIKPNLEALQDLFHKHNPPGKLLYKVNENKDEFQKYKEKLDSFKRELLSKHAVINEMTGQPETLRDEEGNPTNKIKFRSEEDKEIYEEIMNEAYDDTVDVEVKTVNVRRVEDVELPPELVFQLRWMFE